MKQTLPILETGPASLPVALGFKTTGTMTVFKEDETTALVDGTDFNAAGSDLTPNAQGLIEIDMIISQVVTVKDGSTIVYKALIEGDVGGIHIMTNGSIVFGHNIKLNTAKTQILAATTSSDGAMAVLMFGDSTSGYFLYQKDPVTLDERMDEADNVLFSVGPTSGLLTNKIATTGSRELNSFRVNFLRRWAEFIVNDESSGNAGSDYRLVRHDDAGVNIGTALTIERATGAWSSDDASFIHIMNTGAIAFGHNIKLNAAKTQVLARATSSSGAMAVVMFGDLASGYFLYQDDNVTEDGQLNVTANLVYSIAFPGGQVLNETSTTGSREQFSYKIAALRRFAWFYVNTEPADDSGSDLALVRYNDAGTNVGTVLTINRSTGDIIHTGIRNFADDAAATADATLLSKSEYTVTAENTNLRIKA